MSTTPNHEKSVAPVRLNLGCGDKILPGYINIDTVSARKEKKPDIVADIRDLRNIKTSIADEILAVHVIEHFYYWEVIPLLTSWKRILKPGGKIILECPNLLYACKMLLENPGKASSADQNGQMSMWPLYGDPSWKDPLMCHKWAYTPDSLIKVVASAGFINAKQEKAQFKLQEPRDMRITGINQ
ncbi:MAG: methyltransferase domain-containing protein [Synechococcus sp. BS301-5m-G54]|nr:methyltransferase domain-containing protein [Synechococcus sp. BS301-5m-G54]